MSKQRASKLDQYAEVLMGMDAEKKTLAEMQAWLKAEGCTISPGALSSWLSGERSRRMQSALLAQIATGARTVKEVESEFAKHPAPGLETIAKMLRVFVLQLSTQANVQPELFELVTPLMKSVMDFAKLELAGKEFSLAKDKFEFDAAQACLAKLPELKAVSDAPKLTADEKAKAIQQILFPK